MAVCLRAEDLRRAPGSEVCPTSAHLTLWFTKEKVKSFSAIHENIKGEQYLVLVLNTDPFSIHEQYLRIKIPVIWCSKGKNITPLRAKHSLYLSGRICMLSPFFISMTSSIF